MNEIRNELLNILNMVKEKDQKQKDFQIDWLLENFKNDLEDKQKDLEYRLQEVKSNLETLKYVKEAIEIERKGEQCQDYQMSNYKQLILKNYKK